MVLIALLLLAAPGPSGGEVRLPLRDYVALVDAAERASRKAPAPEAPVAQLVSHETRIVVGDSDVVEISVTAEAQFDGSPLRPLDVPVPGTVQRATVSPAGALLSRREALALVPTRPGRYRVQVVARAKLADADGARVLLLPATSATASRVHVEMAPETAWEAADGVLLEDDVRGDRRFVAFTTPAGAASRLALRRDVRGAEAEKVLARAVVVTLLDVGRDVVQRHDVLLHEVRRGELRSLEATLPEGYEPETTATDEGAVAQPARDGRRVAVPRQRRLTATGYLAISRRVPLAETVPVPAVEPSVTLRARYLAVSSRRVAEVVPQPPAAWVRVDVSDLPEPLRSDAPALGIFAVWREREAAGPRSVALRVPPATELGPTPVRQRTTTTLVTSEGRVLHRDRLLVDGVSEAVELDVSGTEVWSAQVEGEATVPLVQGSRVRVPLAGRAGDDVEVELITVGPLVLPAEGTLELALPKLAGPVLEHSWRVLLPPERRYRFERSTLQPALTGHAQDEAGGPVALILTELPTASARVGPGNATIRGIGVDAQNGVLPGLSVTLVRDGREVRRLTLGANGRFAFEGLAPGRYEVRCEMAGFAGETVRVRLDERRTALAACVMRVASLSEMVEVVAEAPQVASADVRLGLPGGVVGGVIGGTADQTAFEDEVEELKQGLVGGVRPVPVEVPEEGKLLTLAGALPPPDVTLRLDVKKAR